MKTGTTAAEFSFFSIPDFLDFFHSQEGRVIK